MSRRTTRRVALATAVTLTATALAACGSSEENSGTDGKLKVAVFPGFISLGVYQAQADGAFERHGLDVTFVTANTPADIAPQLSSGQVQFGAMEMVTPVMAAAKAQTPPFVLSAPAIKGTPIKDGWGTGNFFTKKGSSIKSVKDLTGKKFSIPQLNGQVWLDVRSAIDKAGGDSSKVQWVQIPDPAQSLAQVKSGQVDATTSMEPYGTMWGTDPGVQQMAGFVSNEGHIAFAYASTSEFAKKNPELVKKFTAAVLEGNKSFNALDPQKRAALALKINDKWPKDLLPKARYSLMSEEAVSVKDMEYSVTRMKKYGMLDKSSSLDPAKLVVSD